MAKKKKFYVVWEGNMPGIYDSWADCQVQIKGYPGARYKSFKTQEEAEAAYHSSFADHIETSTTRKTVKKQYSEESKKEIIWDSIAVDAACSGNPGPLEYQGVDTQTGMQLFHQKFPLGTNNIGEFLALVHGIAQLKKEGRTIPIYSDSKHAMTWVKRCKCNTTLVQNSKTAQLFKTIARAEKWLRENEFENELIKWKTKEWGEIPADFGRK